MNVQGNWGEGSDDYSSMTYAGLSGGYTFGNGISGIAEYQYVGVDTMGVFTTIELGASYEVVPGGSFYATVGSLGYEVDGGGDDPFYAIGATFDFGGTSGTTFKQRSYFELPYLFLAI